MKRSRVALFALVSLLATALPGLALAAPAAGDLVLAVWGPDGFSYPARVAAVEGDQLKVAYYDGDVAKVPRDKVRAMDWKVGTEVQCNWKNKGKYYPGKIARMEGEALFIHYNDGDKEEAGIGRCRSK